LGWEGFKEGECILKKAKMDRKKKAKKERTAIESTGSARRSSSHEGGKIVGTVFSRKWCLKGGDRSHFMRKTHLFRTGKAKNSLRKIGGYFSIRRRAPTSPSTYGKRLLI